MKFACKLATVISMAAACSTAIAQSIPSDHKVFQLGRFDQSSSEFHGGQPNKPVVVNIDEGSSERQWFAEQPAISDALSASQSGVPLEPRTIQFSLPAQPDASYRLHLVVILESRSVPALLVKINGKAGKLYLDSHLDSRIGSMDDSYETAFLPVDVAFEFPGAFLHKGTNTIALQATQVGPPTGLPAGINYDAIELDGVGSNSAATSDAKIVPTIFYQRQGRDLQERVDVFIRHEQPVRSGTKVRLTVGNTNYAGELKTSEDFGEERVEFWIPEFSAQTKSRLEWPVEGQQHSQNEDLTPAKKWTVLLVPHIHLDVGYSDYQPKVAAIQSRAIDEAMDFAQKNPDFRFSTDGFWNLEQFWNTHTPAEQQRVVDAMQNKQVSVPAEYANLLTGFPTAETLIRSLYPSATFSREHGTPFNYADIADVPSYSWSYASILASSGIPYLIAGPNGHETRAPVLLQGRLNESSPFWWEGPDGKKVLFWYARHYMEMEILFGRPPLVAAAYQTLPLFLQAYERDSYHATSALMFGSQQENTDLFPQQAELAKEWNALYAYPRLEYAGFHEALKQIVDQIGTDIPTVSGDGGPYWEDGIASNARLAAIERGNESRGPAAEQLATITTLVNPRLAVDKTAVHRMWRNMLLADEHTFTSHDSVSDPTSDESIRQSAFKTECVSEASSIADNIAKNSMENIADAIPIGRQSLIVFNTLNWKRSGEILFDLHHGEEIVDSITGKTVPVETLSEEQNLSHVRFIAHDVPATGYKVFTLERGHPAEQVAGSSNTEIESRYYKVKLDPSTGAVLSIFDKEQKRELVDEHSPYRFGQYVYVAGGDQRPNSLLQYRFVPMPPPLQITGAHNGHLVSTVRVPDGWVSRMESEDENTPKIVTEIRVFDDEKKIEITEDLDKQAVRTREGVYFAFPFAMDHPQFQYEIQSGVVDPAKNMYPGAGHVWFSVQHWVSVQQNGFSATVMPLDAGLVTLGDVHRGVWPEQFRDRNGTVFSFVMNNYWSTNYLAAQGGHFRFRYVITSAPSTQPPALSRMGWEAATNLELDEVTTQDKAAVSPSALDGKEGSFLDVNDPNILMSSWKVAEDGNGMIVRFLDLGGTARNIDVVSPLLDLSRVTLTDAVERDTSPIALKDNHRFSFPIGPHEIVTVRMIGTDKETAERPVVGSQAQLTGSSSHSGH